MTSEDHRSKFINKIHGYEIVAPSGYEMFILRGLKDVIKKMIASK